MKKYISLAKMLFAVVAVAIFTASCEKTKTVTPTSTEGITYIKILKGGDDNPAPIVKNPIDFVPTPTKLLVVDLRREVPNAEELNKTVTVTIKDDTAAVKSANAAYEHLPTAWYTIQGDGVKTGGQGGSYSFTFLPGEYGKQIYITVPNATLLNPSALYGLGFTISSSGGVAVRAKSVVIEIGAKNAYDGVYAVTGPMADAVSPSLVQWNNSVITTPLTDPFVVAHGGAWELHLITSGATQCIMYDNTIWGDYFHPIGSAGQNSGYGSFALVVNFNPANNTISSVTNYYGQPAGNTRSAVLDPSGANAVQGNKDILIKYFMIQTNQPTGTGPRTTFNEKWEYIGSR